ncbi:hypothetical protein [Streptomyces sp. MMG1121]|uniref:hypothetical protein n=1 Tax=Streptomyces sp. MMG1121 TaxID=1415544 RepID=UPI000AE29F5F|nr:hypothetical protein [Streptomyces sp. MMG1121]
MRNQGAHAAAWAAVAVLGLAVPVAAADGMGNGGGPTENDSHFTPANGGISGNIKIRIHGHFNDGDRRFGDRSRGDSGRGDSGRDPGRGYDFGRGDDSCACEDGGGRGDDGGGRRDGGRDDGGRRDGGRSGGGRDDGGRDEGGRGDGGRDDGDPRRIVALPGVVARGARLTVAVDGCRDGAMGSGVFPTTRLNPFRDDTSRGSTLIDHDARPGRYDIRVRCDGRTLTRSAAFTVIGGVHGGAGGSRSTGATPADMAIGGALVGSAVIAGGVYWLRRRNEKRI